MIFLLILRNKEDGVPGKSLHLRKLISAGIPFGTVARKSELHCSFIDRTVVPDTVNSIVNVLLYVLDCSRLRELAHITRLGVVCCFETTPQSALPTAPRQRGG